MICPLSVVVLLIKTFTTAAFGKSIWSPRTNACFSSVVGGFTSAVVDGSSFSESLSASGAKHTLGCVKSMSIIFAGSCCKEL